MKHWLIILLLMPSLLQAEGMEDALRLVESLQMARLARLQERLPVPVKPFASDGCSGGMSAGWTVFAEGLPGVAKKLGRRPPWEGCCVIHDRAYWQGRGEGGYAARLAADQALRQCVLDTAAAEGDAWAAQVGIPPERMQALMRQVAGAMYLAVRLGGGPCTGLPWRWGHGWPECDSLPDDRHMARMESGR
ncbi:MAG: hypothetical protein D6717_11220 [Gammaproteobacteria bacterium]|nr:MAG: hypothetical protein D6717_11220 [Gammaproteobacteria bacterium]